MSVLRRHEEIIADSLLSHGIIDAVRTPLGGVDRHPDIPWRRVSGLTIQAAYIAEGQDDATPSVHHHLKFHFKKNKPRPINFVVRQGEGEAFDISTVAGATEGLVSLSLDASREMARLLMDSLQPEPAILPLIYIGKAS